MLISGIYFLKDIGCNSFFQITGINIRKEHRTISTEHKVILS